VPISGAVDRAVSGHQIPVKGAVFPERLAPVIEFDRAAILNALTRIERRHSTSQHMRGDTEPPGSCEELQVNAGSGPEGPRALNEGSPRAEIDQGDSVAGPQDGLRS
jgi:hypothetical protein